MTFPVSTLALLAAVAGAVGCAGVIVAIRGLRPAPVPAGPTRPSAVSSALRWLFGIGVSTRERTVRHLHMTLAGATAAAVWLITTVPATGIIAGAAVLGLPKVITVGGAGKARIARLDALASWTRSLATRISAGSGLEQALIESAQDAADPIAAEVRALSARMQAGQPAEIALRQFADEMADGVADFLAIALMRSTVTRGSGLRASLERLAGSVDKLVSDQRAVEADRARPRVTARLVTLITVGAFGVLQANTQFMAPYHTLVGQLVLLGIATAFGGCLLWMAALTRGRPEPRMLGEKAAVAPTLQNFGSAI